MRIGRDTGSLMNAVMAGPAAVPEIGTGVTILLWSDRYPGTVIATTPHTITVREDRAILVEGHAMTERQRYRFDPDPAGRVWTFRRTKRGGWTSGGTGLHVGSRGAYRDPSF